MLTEIVKEILAKKQPRYISGSWIREFYPKFYSELLDKTSFLLKKDLTIAERLFCYVNDITEQPVCKLCKTPIFRWHSYNDTKEFYTEGFCSLLHEKSYFPSMQTELNLNCKLYSKEELENKFCITEKLLVSLSKNDNIINSVKTYLKLINVDFKRMSNLESVYFIKNRLTEIPRCIKCKDFCNYKGAGVYHKFCSTKCSANSTETSNKRAETVKAKYGSKVSNVFQSEMVKDKIKQTCLQKYGVDSFAKTDKFKEDYKKQMLEKYGVKNVFCLKETVDKIKQTCLQKYGVDSHSKTISFKNQISFFNKAACYNNLLDNQEFKDKFTVLFSIDNYFGTRKKNLDNSLSWIKYPFKCNRCDCKFSSIVTSTNDISSINCPVCDRNKAQQELASFINKFTIITYNDRSMIYPEELDVFLSDKKIAFEYNGLYWHSTKFVKNLNKHFDKYNTCKEKDISLYAIEDSEWRFRNKEVKAFIKRKLQLLKQIEKNIEFYLKERCKFSIYEQKFIEKYDFELLPYNLAVFGKIKNRIVFCSKISDENIISISTLNNFSYIDIEKQFINFLRNNSCNKMICLDRRLFSKKELDSFGLTFVQVVQPTVWFTRDFLEKVIATTEQQLNIADNNQLYIDYGRWLFKI